MPRRTAVDIDRRLADAVERLGNGLRGLAQHSARAEGLTPLQQFALLTIHREHGRPEVGALAGQADVSAPTMSDAVAALERKGLLQRVVGTDARRRELTLTVEGRRLAGRLVHWDAPVLDALSSLDVAHKGVALDVLLTVIGSLAADGTIGIARTCTTCRFFRRDVSTGATPHFCGLLEAPLARSDLRTDCPEHLAG